MFVHMKDEFSKNLKRQSESRSDFVGLTPSSVNALSDNEILKSLDRIMNLYFLDVFDYRRIIYYSVIIPDRIEALLPRVQSIWGIPEDVAFMLAKHVLTGAIKFSIYPSYVTRDGYDKEQRWYFPYLKTGVLATQGILQDDIWALRVPNEPYHLQESLMVRFNEPLTRYCDRRFSGPFIIDDGFEVPMYPTDETSDEELTEQDIYESLGLPSPWKGIVEDKLKIILPEGLECPLINYPEQDELGGFLPEEVVDDEYMRSVRKAIQFIFSNFNEQVLGDEYVIFESFYNETQSLNIRPKPDSLLQKVYHLLGDWFASRDVSLRRKCSVAYRIYSVIWQGEIISRKGRKIMCDYEGKTNLPPRLLACRRNWSVTKGVGWWGALSLPPVRITMIEFSFRAICEYVDVSREDPSYVGYYNGTYGLSPGFLSAFKQLSRVITISFFDDDPHPKRARSTAVLLSGLGTVGETRNSGVYRVVSEDGRERGHYVLDKGEAWCGTSMLLRALIGVG